MSSRAAAGGSEQLCRWRVCVTRPRARMLAEARATERRLVKRCALQSAGIPPQKTTRAHNARRGSAGLSASGAKRHLLPRKKAETRSVGGQSAEASRSAHSLRTTALTAPYITHTKFAVPARVAPSCPPTHLPPFSSPPFNRVEFLPRGRGPLFISFFPPLKSTGAHYGLESF